MLKLARPVQRHYKILEADLDKESKLYGFGFSTYHVKVDIIERLGQGSEGEAYQITLKQNVF